MLVAAGLVPILAMVGGAVDMGRSYLAQSRLQSACDAGVLAARKALGSSAVLDGQVPSSVATSGNAFFNANFRNGSYGTSNRQFVMALEGDYSISGTATVSVPTTIMKMFGFTAMGLTASCRAKLAMADTDVMMVLDVTGSMSETNPGDTKSKLATMRDVIRSFHAQLEASKPASSRIRYGFVPYAVNVNVGGLLKSDWLVDRWDYNGREVKKVGQSLKESYLTTSTKVSGSFTKVDPYVAATCPESTTVTTELSHSTSGLTESGRTRVQGSFYSCTYDAGTGDVTVAETDYDDYVYDWTRTLNGVALTDDFQWRYRSVKVDTSYFKGATGSDPPQVGKIMRLPIGGTAAEPENLDITFKGCIEERDTYEIDDYNNVDLGKALDLDLDAVPGNQDKTKWRPMLHELSFERSIISIGVGSFLFGAITTLDEYLNAGEAGISGCPAPARKLAPMSADEISNYVDSLRAGGNTYHDIGMIWGGRLISPTGLFAAENAALPGRTLNRNLILLTDGYTVTNKYMYGAYGVEPLDRRRWSESSSRSLNSVVEKRFALACEEVRKKNVSIWVIAFGIDLNPILSQCGGASHAFSAKNATELSAAFAKIAASMGDLRISN